MKILIIFCVLLLISACSTEPAPEPLPADEDAVVEDIVLDEEGGESQKIPGQEPTPVKKEDEAPPQKEFSQQTLLESDSKIEYPMITEEKLFFIKEEAIWMKDLVSGKTVQINEYPGFFSGDADQGMLAWTAKKDGDLDLYYYDGEVHHLSSPANQMRPIIHEKMIYYEDGANIIIPTDYGAVNDFEEVRNYDIVRYDFSTKKKQFFQSDLGWQGFIDASGQVIVWEDHHKKPLDTSFLNTGRIKASVNGVESFISPDYNAAKPKTNGKHILYEQSKDDESRKSLILYDIKEKTEQIILKNDGSTWFKYLVTDLNDEYTMWSYIDSDREIYVYDFSTGKTELIAQGHYSHPWLSDDGLVVVESTRPGYKVLLFSTD